MALVEMAIVGSLLVFLLFGIVTFGYLMSFRQNMVQAAAEGARAGAVAATSSDPATNAQAAATRSISSFHSCDGSALVCASSVGACPNNTAVQCVTVTLTYNYGDHPLLPQVPIVSSFIPSTVGPVTAVAEINR